MLKESAYVEYKGITLWDGYLHITSQREWSSSSRGLNEEPDPASNHSKWVSRHVPTIPSSIMMSVHGHGGRSCLINTAHLWSREQVCASNAVELTDVQRIEHFALDPCICPGQMDGKLILVMWVRGGRRILVWPQDFQDLSDDTSGQKGVREMTCYIPRLHYGCHLAF